MEEKEAVFLLLRSAVAQDACPAVAISASQWWGLFRLLQRNHVAALCCQAARQAGAPREVLLPWMAEREKAAAWHRHQLEVQQEVDALMQRHGIPVLVLKGTRTARHYPQPHLREFGDLDLYFHDRHGVADRVAAAELGVSIRDDSHHHTKYDYRGVTVESHYDLLNTHYPPSNKRYEALLKSLLPGATFEVLFLLRHMAVHFASSRITLRDLCDWALTCHALEPSTDWDLVQQTIEDYGMGAFADQLNTLAKHRLGMAAPLRAQTYSEWLERDLLYGSLGDHPAEDMGRLLWKLRRWRATRWKRQMVYGESDPLLLLSSIASHAMKPRSILHKM